MKNANISLYRTALRTSSALVIAAAIGSPALAQDTAPPTAGVSAETPTPPSDETIVVTGSRIARPQVESVSPVTVLGAEEIANTGTVRAEDLVNSLPQAFAAQSSFISNGASGTASVNLRGLGTVRTLVLIDGRRMQPGDPFEVTADINQIPAALIERVEVVTGGASSVYGADAVAGVVNFIMKRDFEGFGADAQVSFYQHDNNNKALQDLLARSGNDVPEGNEIDGFGYDFNVQFGAGFDDGRGHVTAYAGYRQIDAITQANRDYSACALDFDNSDPTGYACTGSSTTPAGRTIVLSAGPGGTPFGDDLTLDETGPGNTFRPRVGTDVYNFAPTNYYQRPDKRYTAGFFADYEISEALKPYAEFEFMDDRSVAQIAFSGSFFAANIPLSCESPLLSDQQKTAVGCTRFTQDADPSNDYAEGIVVLNGKRVVEGLPRQNDLRHSSYRTVLGLKGDLNDSWRYDAYVMRGDTIYSNTYLNDLSVNRINQAIDSVRDANGNIVCRDPSNGCVPLDIFTLGGVTRDAFNFIAVPGLQNADIKQYVASGYVSGDLGSLTGTSQGVGVVLGAEYRKELLQLRVDENFSTGALAGQGGPTAPVDGKFSVREVFGELSVPLLEDLPFAQELTLEGGFRYSDYTTTGSSSTYKIGATWAPVDALRFRGVYSRSVRAPNIVELFSPQTVGLFGGTDPCAGPAVGGLVNGNTAAQCANSGVSAAQFGTVLANSANQYNQLAGGNPGLDVEKADSYTLGVILDGASFLPGFTATVDYFNIKVKNTISGLGAQQTLNTCVATGDPFFCSLVQRAPGTGSLFLGSSGFVVNTQQNIGGLKTEGIDIGANYRRPVGNGSAFVDYAGTVLLGMKIQTRPDLNFFDCAGLYGNICSNTSGLTGPNPKYRHRLRLGYNSDSGWGMTFGWRYFGGVKVDAASSDPQLADPGSLGTVDDKIKAFNWFDLSGSYDVSDAFRLTAGVNNIFDREPPTVGGSFAAGFSNGNTYPGHYDPVGRYVFVRGRVTF